MTIINIIKLSDIGCINMFDEFIKAKNKHDAINVNTDNIIYYSSIFAYYRDIDYFLLSSKYILQLKVFKLCFHTL